MEYTTLNLLQKYTGRYDEDPIMQELYLDTAESVVNNYLGYKPTAHFETEFIYKDADNAVFFLHSLPIVDIYLLRDLTTGKVINMEYRANRDMVLFYNHLPYTKLEVKYIAGWGFLENQYIEGGSASVTYEDMIQALNGLYETISAGGAEYPSSRILQKIQPIPKVIVQTALRIAALLQTEGDNNIGITGASFGDSGSRTFINYTNYDKYLSPLQNYRLTVI